MQTLIPFIPAGLWLLAAALTVAVLLIFFFLHFFWRKRQQAFLQDGGDAADMAAYREQLRADVNALRDWMDQHKSELLRLTSEREEQERVRNELSDLEQRCLAKDQENEALRREVGELENRKHLAAQTLEQLLNRIGDIEDNRIQAEALKHEIEGMQAQLAEAREILARIPETEIRLNALTREKEKLEEHIHKLKETCDSEKITLAEIRSELQHAEIEMEKLRDIRKEYAQLDVLVDSLRSEQNALERDVVRLEEMVSSLSEKASILSNKYDEEHSAYEGLASQLALKREDLDRTQEAVQKLEVRKDRLELEVEKLAEASMDKSAYEELARQLAIRREELDRIQEIIQRLEIRKDRLESEVEKLTTVDTETTREDTCERYADLLVRNANSLRQNEFSNQELKEDEYGALETFKSELQQSGIHFPDRVVDAFHTSLKCQGINPLTVLAGVSGTGKTLLPMKYAEFMGLHSLVIPVQPRWDSPQDLFGFYNYLEKEYKSTELSRALVRMDKYNYPDSEYGSKYAWPRKRLLMVLLDEMNLARTEYYFSEFLSKLELRRQVDNPDNPALRAKAEVELDTGPGSKRSFRIWVPENVLFVGTMNEDETTQTLSDKVLDRSNVLRFGKPDERQNIQAKQTIQGQQRPHLTYEKWRSWQRDSRPNDSWWSEASRWIRSINDGLDRVGRPFGFRVEDAIHLYLANYPRVNSEDRYKLAFADQIEQKIIPKLRGLDMNDPNTTVCLGEVETVIGVLGDGALSRTFNAAKEESRNLGMFTWRGVTRPLNHKE